DGGARVGAALRHDRRAGAAPARRLRTGHRRRCRGRGAARPPRRRLSGPDAAMKVVILAGGRGTRLAEETAAIPKPMVAVGGRPILWHIMRLYAHFGLTDFVVCLGYKGHVIKEYFASYLLHRSDLTVDLGANRIDYHNR